MSTAPAAPDSAALVGNLVSQVAGRYSGVAALNVHQYNIAFFTARPGERAVDIRFDDCQHKGYLPRGLTGPGGQFTAVPVPADALGSVGNDRSVSIYQPSTDTLWSFWKFSRDATGVSACWGGRLDHVSRSSGIFPGGFGTSASGLAYEGGAVSIAEARSRVIPHAVAIGIPSVAHWKQFSWPAQRSDGHDRSQAAIPMGTRFRLDPSVDVASLHLHPLAAAIAAAAQEYGFVVVDSAGAVAISTESGAPAQARTGTDPWGSLLGGTPSYAVLKGFPWDRLQALPRDYGRPAG